MAKTLNAKQRRFAQEYLVDLNATQAAIRAGYSSNSAEQQGWDLLRNPKVAALVDELRQRRSDRVEVKSDDVLRELLRLAMVDIGEAFDDTGKLKSFKDMPVDVRRAIASVKVLDGDEAGLVMEVKFWDKKGSLELLGKHLKLFTEKIEHSGTLTLEQLVTASMVKP